MESLADEQTDPSAKTYLEMLFKAKIKKENSFLSFDARNDCIPKHICSTMTQTREGASNNNNYCMNQQEYLPSPLFPMIPLKGVLTNFLIT